MNHRNNFGKLVRKIELALMVGVTSHEIYEALDKEGDWAPDSIHEAIKQAMKNLE